MGFKTLSLSAAAATALVAGSTMAISSAQAATLTPGSFTLTPPTVTQSGGNLLLNFTGTATGSGGLAGLTGAPVLSSITLTPSGAGTFTSGPVSNFIVGTIGGDPASVNLLSSTFSGFFNSASDNLLGTFALNFTVSSLGVTQLAGQGAVFTSATFPAFNQASFNAAQAIPTPALVPGLISFGLLALRKRRTAAQELN
jgi:hypothetical protein